MFTPLILFSLFRILVEDNIYLTTVIPACRESFSLLSLQLVWSLFGRKIADKPQ